MNDIALNVGAAEKAIVVRRATLDDLPALGDLNTEGFSGNKTPGSGERWLRAYLSCDMFRVWIAEYEGTPAGYIVWQIKGGFNRENPTTELEQLVVSAAFRQKGLSRELQEQTLPLVSAWIRETNENAGYMGQIVVWVDAENEGGLATYAKRFPKFGGHRCEYIRNGSRLEEVQRKGTMPIPLKQ